MDTAILFFIGGIVLLVIFVFHTMAASRRKRLAAYAAAQGWEFHPEKDKNWRSRYPSFKCLHRGHSRYAYNRMHGQRDGKDVTAFDYHYATGHGKHRSDHHFSALIVKSPILLKPLYLRPENIFDKVSDFFGFDDIDFESAEFSRKFYVKAPEKRWAYDVIHPRMMEYLLDAPRFHVQFDPESIISWKSGRFKEEDFDEAFALIQEMLGLLPEYVKKGQADAGPQAETAGGEK